MTVNNTGSVVGPTTGNGSQTVFVYNKRVDANAYLKVIRTDLTTGVVTPLTEGPDYSIAAISGGPPYLNGVNVTTSVAPTSNQSITIYRQTPVSQDYPVGSMVQLPSAIIESSLDKQIEILQEQNDKLGSTLQLPAGVSGVLTGKHANWYLKYDATAQNIIADPGSTVISSIGGTAPITVAGGTGPSSTIGIDILAPFTVLTNKLGLSLATPLAVNGSNQLSLSFASPLVNNAGTLNLALTSPLANVSNSLALNIAAPLTTSGGNLTATFSTNDQVATGTDTSSVLNPAVNLALHRQGADIASASTLTIPSTGTNTGAYHNVTGTTTITGLSCSSTFNGRRVILKFAGALVLTHNATSLILPTAANITTAAGDVAEFVCENNSSQNWRCIQYQRANGQALASSGGGSSGLVLLATVTPTAVTTINFTSLMNSTLYRYYILEGQNILPTTTSNALSMVGSANNGSTWSSSGHKHFLFNASFSGASTSITASVASSFAQICQVGSNTNGVSFRAEIHDQAIFTTSETTVGASNPTAVLSAIADLGFSGVNAIQLLWSAGSTFQASGTLKFYGVTN